MNTHGIKFRALKAPTDTPETPEDIAKLMFPMYMAPKIDGIRMTNFDGMRSAQNKILPSAYIKSAFDKEIFHGVDGEVACGESNSPTIFSDTFSAIMTHGCQTPVNWYAFDYCKPAASLEPYWKRLQILEEKVEIYRTCGGLANIQVVKQTLVTSWDDVLEMEQQYLADGYEGGMLRGPNSYYKFGRSTLKQNILIKIKRFETCEAIITGFYELEHNDNVSELGSNGLSTRSSHRANMRPGNTLGGFCVRDIKSGVEFRLGSGLGLDIPLRQTIWNNREDYLGKIVSYKKLKIGEKDKPRNCTFRGFRDPMDM